MNNIYKSGEKSLKNTDVDYNMNAWSWITESSMVETILLLIKISSFSDTLLWNEMMSYTKEELER